MRQETADKLKELEQQMDAVEQAYRAAANKVVSLSDSDLDDSEELIQARNDRDALEVQYNSLKEQLRPYWIFQSFDDKIDMIRMFAPIGKLLLDEFKGDAIGALAGALSILIEARQNLDGQLSLLDQINAQSKFRRYEYYKTAGFSAEQAFALILASTQPVSLGDINKISQGVSSLTQTAKHLGSSAT